MSGDGVDVGHIATMLEQVIVTQDRQGRTLDEHGRMLGRLDQQVGDLDRKVGALDRKVDDLSSQVGGLRQAVTEYHSAVLGHGVLISDLDERLRRVERHLGLSAA